MGRSLAELTLVGKRIEQFVKERSLEVELEFRPHTHHWLALEQVRNGSAGAGIVELDGVPATAFATSWGDGVWDVYRDLDADGRITRIRIELADPATLDRLRSPGATSRRTR